MPKIISLGKEDTVKGKIVTYYKNQHLFNYMQTYLI